MLKHLGEPEAAQRIEDAVFVTLEEGKSVTLDVARQSGNVEASASTSGFADTVIENLGRAPAQPYPTKGQAPASVPAPLPRWKPRPVDPPNTQLLGVDVYTEMDGDPQPVGKLLDEAAGPEFKLLLMSARGTVVYPSGNPHTDTVGWWRCRFVAAEDGGTVDDAAVLRLLGRIGEKMTWAHVQKLRIIEGETGFTKAQGQ
jgi:isocitrate dehydrogenase